MLQSLLYGMDILGMLGLTHAMLTRLCALQRFLLACEAVLYVHVLMTHGHLGLLQGCLCIHRHALSSSLLHKSPIGYDALLRLH